MGHQLFLHLLAVGKIGHKQNHAQECPAKSNQTPPERIINSVEKSRRDDCQNPQPELPSRVERRKRNIIACNSRPDSM